MEEVAYTVVGVPLLLSSLDSWLIKRDDRLSCILETAKIRESHACIEDIVDREVFVIEDEIVAVEDVVDETEVVGETVDCDDVYELEYDEDVDSDDVLTEEVDNVELEDVCKEDELLGVVDALVV